MEFEAQEEFLFAYFDITPDAVYTSIFPDENDFYRLYLDFFIKRRQIVFEYLRRKEELNKS